MKIDVKTAVKRFSMTEDQRQSEIKKLANQIAIRVKKLEKLNCSYSDQASTILLFDDSKQDLLPEERSIGDLRNGVDQYNSSRC